MTYVVARFDMRAPGADATERSARYRAAIDMALFADESGVHALNVSEHHGVGGRVPAVADRAGVGVRRRHLPDPHRGVGAHRPVVRPGPVGRGSLRARPRRRRPLQRHPRPRLPAGRVRPALAGVDAPRRATRPPPRDDARGVGRRADGHPPARRAGSRHRHAPPLLQPAPPGLRRRRGPAARRAARFGLPFQPQLDDPRLTDLYREECRRLGREPGLVVAPIPGPASVFCALDPEEFWERHGEALLADSTAYRAWQDERASDDPYARGRSSFVHSDATTVDELRAEGVVVVATPDELIDRARSGELGLISCHPLCGGLPIEAGFESLRLVGDEVLPALR